MEKQIKLFLEFLENDKKLSANTLQSYRRDIVQFQEYLDNQRLVYSKVSQQEIKDYINYLSKIGKKTSTISRNLASIRSFYQFELRTKKVKRDPSSTCITYLCAARTMRKRGSSTSPSTNTSAPSSPPQRRRHGTACAVWSRFWPNGGTTGTS